VRHDNHIAITEDDYASLQRLIQSRRQSNRDSANLDALETELERASIMSSEEIPHDVVTMNSRVRVRDLDKGSEMVYQVVFPGEANAEKNRISVLAPLGTGLLGYKAGSVIEWPVPSGIRRLHIIAVEYQPNSTSMAA